jgi:uncharacterized membrane protein required for colicin V production
MNSRRQEGAMNLIDITLLLLLMIFLALGFAQGIIKLLVAFVAFYVSLILASLYFQILGQFFRSRLRTNLEVSQIVAFTIILLVGFLLLTLAGLYTFRYAKLPSSLDSVDKIVGTLLGLVLGAFFSGMLAKVLVLLFINRNPASEIDFPIMGILQNGVRESNLIVIFTQQVLPLMFNILRPFIRPEAYFIFQIS